MDKISFAVDELSSLLPGYLVDNRDELGAFFRGLLEKTRDSLIAIDKLKSIGAIWPIHCRWIVEAFASATVLHEDPSKMASFKRSSMNTYLLVIDVPDAVRTDELAKLSTANAPDMKAALAVYESKLAEVQPGLLYKYYRLLCEYSHVEVIRTSAYPRFGTEGAETLELRKASFLWLAGFCALNLPALAHCPPACGFSDEGCERAMELTRVAAQDLPPVAST